MVHRLVRRALWRGGVELSAEGLREFFESVVPVLDERQRRLVAGGVARALGRGGPTRVCEASCLSRNTVIAGDEGTRRRGRGV